MSQPLKRAFVVGHPIAHSRSPLIHGHWLAEHGIAGSYERIDVAPDAFAGFVSRLADEGFAGGNVLGVSERRCGHGRDKSKRGESRFVHGWLFSGFPY